MNMYIVWLMLNFVDDINIKNGYIFHREDHTVILKLSRLRFKYFSSSV